MKRILVVEDEPAIAFGLQLDLKGEGYEVEIASDGESALRRAQKEKFDLILLDLMLPGKDGFEVCRELRRAGVRRPVILLTWLVRLPRLNLCGSAAAARRRWSRLSSRTPTHG